MAVAIMPRFYIDISPYWKKGRTVNAVYNEYKGTENEIGRHTLTRAKEGRLEKADIESIVKLAKLCSIWANKELTPNDLIVEEKID